MTGDAERADDADAPTDRPGPFRFDYEPGTIRYGRGCVGDLGEELATLGVERALVVSGSTVGTTPEVVGPVEAGLGERHAGTFAGTTPEKLLGTAYDAVEAIRAAEADGVVALGGGSSLDTAKAVAVLAATDRSPDDVGDRFAATGALPVPEGPLPPVVAVPTTLAGADLSQVAGVNARPDTCPVDGRVDGGVSDPRLMPAALFYDPDLFATTPPGVLAGSAMNGFDKGIETLYARTATPVTDATAIRGVELLAAGLPGLRGKGTAAVERSVAGTVLVQYGISRPDAMTLSLIHAFGHGLTDVFDVQQGVAHAVVAPHALRYLFERVDGRRDLLARALGVADPGATRAETAEAVVNAVADVRDGLDLPARFREVEAVERSGLGAAAEATADDGLLGNAPPGLDPTVDELEGVLHEAW